MLNEIVVLLFAVSFRSANIENQPFDYELTAGLSRPGIEADVLFERESGKQYSGYQTKATWKQFRFDSYKRTAKGIDRQKFAFLPWNRHGFSLGLACEAKRWRNPEPQAVALWQYRWLELTAGTGYNRRSMTAKAEYRIRLHDHIFLKPLFVFQRYNKAQFWQAKIGIEIL